MVVISHSPNNPNNIQTHFDCKRPPFIFTNIKDCLLGRQLAVTLFLCISLEGMFLARETVFLHTSSAQSWFPSEKTRATCKAYLCIQDEDGGERQGRGGEDPPDRGSGRQGRGGGRQVSEGQPWLLIYQNIIFIMLYPVQGGG